MGVIDLWTVYIHTNLINGKKYVGITSNPVKKRWRNGYGYSENLPIGRAIRKYGWENFDHEISADNLDEDDAKKMEQELIKSYNTTDDKYGYNVTVGGDGIKGFKHSEASRAKLSEKARQLERFGERNPNYGHKWSKEQRERAAITHKRENLSPETLKKMSESTSKRVGELNSFFGKHHTEQTKQIISKVQSRAVLMFDLEGNLIREYNSIINAAKDNNICKVAISNCCRGLTKTSGGYIWKYKDNFN